MSKKVKIGDLVCMFRRREPGLGIVLKHRNTDKELEQFKLEETLQYLKESGDYRSKNNTRDKLFNEIEKHKNREGAELAKVYLEYNNGWEMRVKKDFVYVKWFNSPSEYEIDKMYRQTCWVPAEWVRSVT